MFINSGIDTYRIFIEYCTALKMNVQLHPCNIMDESHRYIVARKNLDTEVYIMHIDIKF